MTISRPSLLLAVLCASSLAWPQSAPEAQAKRLRGYWRRATFECPTDKAPLALAFEQDVRSFVAEGVQGIWEINRGLAEYSLALASGRVVFQCLGLPTKKRALGEVEYTRQGHEVRLGKVYDELKIVPGTAAELAQTPAGRETLSRYKNTVLHEFLHTVTPGNLRTEDHDSIMPALRPLDVIYSCAGVVFPGDGFDRFLRLKECQTCRLAEVEVDRHRNDAVSVRLKSDPRSKKEAAEFCARLEPAALDPRHPSLEQGTADQAPP